MRFLDADGQGKGQIRGEVMELNGVGGGGGKLGAKVKASPTVRGKRQKGKRQQAQIQQQLALQQASQAATTPGRPAPQLQIAVQNQSSTERANSSIIIVYKKTYSDKHIRCGGGPGGMGYQGATDGRFDAEGFNAS